MTTAYDAIVVGSGPNGLAAAITLAGEGCEVLVVEAAETIGGGLRSAELTVPGLVHDICSAVHPLGVASPFFAGLPLEEHGLGWIHPDVPLAHPLDDGRAVVLERSVEDTAARLGADASAYRGVFGPLVGDVERLLPAILGPLRPPRHPLALARFGLMGLRSAESFAASRFASDGARALFAGVAAHGIMPLSSRPTAAFGLFLAVLGHAVGWPVARGGTGTIAAALAAHLRSLGGTIETAHTVTDVDELPPARAILLDLTPRQLLQVAGHRFRASYRRALERYRYGPGVFKVDWALDGPVPWRSVDCARAGTVHVGGTLEEIAAGEEAVGRGRHPERPFVLVAQQSLFDATRRADGSQALWGYCHVPNGSTVDMTAAIEAQIERFAPGFRDRIVDRQVRDAAAMQDHNSNYVGGDINGGIQDLGQLFTRPAVRPVPYTTPDPRLFVCSSSTPPGGGVHGMCGVFAARAALRRLGQARRRQM